MVKYERTQLATLPLAQVGLKLLVLLEVVAEMPHGDEVRYALSVQYTNLSHEQFVEAVLLRYKQELDTYACEVFEELAGELGYVPAHS